ncbi:unnamed protein product [Dibothriocephalus latus]|uniref:Uncharacterized protein n=1 Tax=Dibothriocephalus latus TaxID=60516 RepID=A0A3P6PW74_DIBLA|nr:unnamed protein product [Dibothriocephalus latus]
MICLIIQDCHARLHKYRQKTDQEKTICCEFKGENSKKLLQQRVLERDCHKPASHEAARENKFHKLYNPTSSRNEILVHNLSSKELTKERLQVLKHEVSFHTADAKLANMIATVALVINQTEATEETKNRIRHQASPLLMAHQPQEVLPKVERVALRAPKADWDIFIVPAKKGRSTVLLARR